MLVRELLILRRERSFNTCEFMIYMSRMFLLTSALKLAGSDWLAPVFVATCGLFQSGMQVFKSMRGKKHFHKLTIEDVKERSQKKQAEKAKAADKMQTKTILVPIERTQIMCARSRGYSASPALDFNFASMESRTRSGGFTKKPSLQIESDLLGGHKVIGENGVID